MSDPGVIGETGEPAPQIQQAAARLKAMEAALAAFADGKPDLAQLLPGHDTPARVESPPRLVW